MSNTSKHYDTDIRNPNSYCLNRNARIHVKGRTCTVIDACLRRIGGMRQRGAPLLPIHVYCEDIYTGLGIVEADIRRERVG